MHSHRSIWSFVIAALCVTVVSPIRAEPSPTLQAPLRALLKGKLAARAQIAFLAVDLADGRTLTAHTPKRRPNGRR